MSIEIRELHIKAVVGTSASQEQSSPPSPGRNEEEREALVSLCVERVMEVLARKAER